MMSAVNSVLRNIILDKKDFCCLCLNPSPDQTLTLDDEITVNINNSEHNLDIAAVLSSVLGKEIYSSIISFDTFCEKCIKSVIVCYRFMTVSQENLDFLTSVLDSLTNSFAYTTDGLHHSKSLYVTLNLNDLSSEHFYDILKRVKTPQAAMERFFSLNKLNEMKEQNNTMKITEQDKTNIKLEDTKTFYNISTNLQTQESGNHFSLVYKDCNQSFMSSPKMHELSHNLIIICEDCGRVYKNNYTFKNHIKLNVCGRETRAHPSEAKFTCDYCGKKYTQKVSLRVHIQYEHGKYKSHICEWCGKKFWAPSRLKAHIVKHTREKNFTCYICSGKFVTKASLLYHTRIHTGEKPYKCPNCDSRFLSSSRRSAHIKCVHQKAAHQCDICHKIFNSRILLLKHRSTHDHISKLDEIAKKEKTDSVKNNSDRNYLNLNSNVKMQEIWKMNESSLQTFFQFEDTDI